MMDLNQLSGDNMQPRTAPYGMFPVASGRPISAFNSASPEVRAQMISAIPKEEIKKYTRRIGPKKQATPKQLEALAKGRAKRAEKKISSATNKIVKAATQIVASVNDTVGPKKRGRKPLSQEEKQIRTVEKETVKLEKAIAREQKRIATAMAKSEKKKRQF
jgi:thioredoxin-like negative regulator of GroEL